MQPLISLSFTGDILLEHGACKSVYRNDRRFEFVRAAVDKIISEHTCIHMRTISCVFQSPGKKAYDVKGGGTRSHRRQKSGPKRNRSDQNFVCAVKPLF